MVLNSAVSVDSAVAWISTDVPVARFITWTIGISYTATDFNNGGCWLTSSASRADITFWTQAIHRSYWKSSNNLTFCRILTRLKNLTRVLAFVVEASLESWTICIFGTFQLDFSSTVNIRISYEAWWASAERHIVLHSAFCLWRARIVVDARVDTLGVDALSIGWTIAIGTTFHNLATIVRVSTVTRQTSAFCTIDINATFCIDSTRIFNDARVDAVAVNAGFTGVTF